MLKQKINKKIDYKFSEYYRVYDSINKYNLKSSFNTPFIKQIIFELPVENTLKAFIAKTQQHSSESGQILTLLFIYVISNFFPYINYNKANPLKLLNKTGYSLKISFNNVQEIYSFLHEIQEKLKLDLLSNFKNTKNQNFFVLTKSCNVDFFSGLTSLLDKYVNIVNSKELFFVVKLNVFKPKKAKFNADFIQNFPFLNK